LAYGTSDYFVVITRSEATKQSSLLLAARLDCFAALAMTDQEARQREP